MNACKIDQTSYKRDSNDENVVFSTYRDTL